MGVLEVLVEEFLVELLEGGPFVSAVPAGGTGELAVVGRFLLGADGRDARKRVRALQPSQLGPYGGHVEGDVVRYEALGSPCGLQESIQYVAEGMALTAGEACGDAVDVRSVGWDDEAIGLDDVAPRFPDGTFSNRDGRPCNLYYGMPVVRVGNGGVTVLGESGRFCVEEEVRHIGVCWFEKGVSRYQSRNRK